MSNAIPFARLRSVLTSLGFQETIVPGSHLAYEHRDCGEAAERCFRTTSLLQRGKTPAESLLLVGLSFYESRQPMPVPNTTQHLGVI